MTGESRRNSAMTRDYSNPMRTSLAFVLGAALALGALNGCDDRSDGKPHVKSAHRPSASAVAPPGVGWRDVAGDKSSTWRFSGLATAKTPADLTDTAPETNQDSLNGIRMALAANTLPPHESVRIADLIVAVTRDAPAPSEQAKGKAQSEAMVTTSPWNDHTWLLWVSVGGLDRAGAPAIRIDFDPKTVASFRALGDVSALPDPRTAGGRAKMLYELSPEPDGPQSPGAVYAVLHVGASDGSAGYDRPIGPADFIDSIDNASDSVRFAAAVAGFAELLRGDPAVRDLSCADVIALAESAVQPDPRGIRAETIELMRRAEPLIDQPPGDAPAEGR